MHSRPYDDNQTKPFVYTAHGVSTTPSEILLLERDPVDLFFDILGYVGGCFMSLCLIPQIIKTCRTRSAKDISYVWQVCSITGLMMVFAYGMYFMLLPVFIPIIIEFVLMVILTVSKICFECQPRKR